MTERTDGGDVGSPATADSAAADQYELFGESIRLEHRRLDEYGKRTELGRLALELNDQHDQRQANFATQQLEADERADIRRHRLALSVFLSVSVVTGVVIATMLAILLFGTSEQSDKALAILKVIGIGGGGFGIGYAVLSAFRGLSRR